LNKKIFYAITFLVFAFSNFASAKTAQHGVYATFYTSKGNIVCKLFEKKAPETVRNFVNLTLGRKEFFESGSRHKRALRPFYNGVIFHRAIPGLLIESGDHGETGAGGPGFFIKDETSELAFDRPGRLAMVRGKDMLVNGSMFFITVRAASQFSGINPIFGQVVEGMDVVEVISKVPLNIADKPLKKIYINKVGIQVYR